MTIVVMPKIIWNIWSANNLKDPILENLRGGKEGLQEIGKDITLENYSYIVNIPYGKDYHMCFDLSEDIF